MVKLDHKEKTKVMIAAALIVALLGIPVIYALMGGGSGLFGGLIPNLASVGDAFEVGETTRTRTTIDEAIDMRESYDAAAVSGLDISWNGGTVLVEQGEGEAVVVEAKLAAGTYDMDPRDASIKLGTGGTIEVSDGLPSSDNGASYPPFNLTITVPRGFAFDAARIAGTAATQRLHGLTCTDLTLETVAGDIDLKGLDAGSLIAETVSGLVTLDGTVTGELSIDDVSGAVGVTVAGALPRSMAIKTVSGAIELGFPEDAGFTLTSDRVSG